MRRSQRRYPLWVQGHALVKGRALAATMVGVATASPGLERRLSTPRVTSSARRPLFYGWRIVGAAFGTQILHSSVLFLSQGFYVVELEATFGWTRGAISWAFALIRLEAGLLGPLQGWMIDRFGPRPVMRIGTLVFGGGLILFARIESLWQLFAVMALVAVGSSLAGFLTIHIAIAHWFVRKRGLAMGLTSTGFAAGALFVPLVGWSIMALGWRPTAVISGVLVLAVGLPAAQVFRRRPQDMGTVPDGEPPPGPEADRGGDIGNGKRLDRWTHAPCPGTAQRRLAAPCLLDCDQPD